MNKSGHANVTRWISIAAALLLVFYVGYQIYRSVFGSVDTEMAVQYSVFESIETKGLILRSETVIPPVNNGSVFYSIENGTRIAKDGIIASVYGDPSDGLIQQRLQEIDDEIKTLQSIQTDNTSGKISLDIINTQLMTTVEELTADTDDGVFSATDAKGKLLSLLSKKQVVTGLPVNFTEKLEKLQEEKRSLQSQFHPARSSVKAPVAGYFADHADGFESVLAQVDPENLGVEELQNYLTMEEPAIPNSGGKIVGGYEWYLACLVPDSYYQVFSVGTTLSVRLTFVSEEEIPVTVVSCQKGADAKIAVVFRCAYMSEALSTIRRETTELLLVRHTGLKVPKRAIVIRDDMQAGVYIRYGNTAVFRKIEQEYSEPADYVICKNNEESGYLHLYDDVIVSGRNLYDGKIIN